MIDPTAVVNYSVAGLSVFLIYKLFKYVICDVKRAIKDLQRSVDKLSNSIDKHNFLLEQFIKNGRKPV